MPPHNSSNVRDIGIFSKENPRVLRSPNNDAVAEYEIAFLKDGRYAVRSRIEYRCGNHWGKAIPWLIYDSRNACVNRFLQIARDQFAPEQRCGVATESQHAARRWMLDVLQDSLFGFLEPEPEQIND